MDKQRMSIKLQDLKLRCLEHWRKDLGNKYWWNHYLKLCDLQTSLWAKE